MRPCAGLVAVPVVNRNPPGGLRRSRSGASSRCVRGVPVSHDGPLSMEGSAFYTLNLTGDRASRNSQVTEIIGVPARFERPLRP
jgi:hypothetical protein